MNLCALVVLSTVNIITQVIRFWQKWASYFRMTLQQSAQLNYLYQPLLKKDTRNPIYPTSRILCSDRACANNPPELLFVRFDSGRITLKDLNPGKDRESSKEQCVLSSYYEDISEDDTIFDLIEELDFSDTSQKFDIDNIIPDVNNNESQDDNIGQLLKESDSQSSKEEQSAENMETDANDQEDNISVITVSDEELCEDTTVGRSGTYVQTIMISMRKRTNYINEEETGSTYDVVN
ncbi:unnamed protein product [Mytilus edulis]|uniref:Uncharacterized protein n=1 Tax=Mytilus edulis TaxID=6550 RepID=A0A8S3SHS1_MYTED|nr:unnamed protein product [Mytilus edulis]